MFKISHLVLLALLLTAFPAVAQPGPILSVEHDWTFRSGSRLHGDYRIYGVYQWTGSFDSKSHTTVCFGQQSCDVPLPIYALMMIICVPLGAMIALMVVRRRRKIAKTR